MFRLLAVTLVPALFLGLLELGLRIFGFGVPTDFFLDGSREGVPGTIVENRLYGLRFFPASLRDAPPPLPVTIAKRKPAGTYRIFVLGESAAMGFPDPSAGFSRVLDVMLRERYPGVKFEVVNTAMVAMNSNVVRLTALECARQEPDLFVVLLGNNEVVGPFGAAGVLGGYAPNLSLIRANLSVKGTRLGQLLHGLVRKSGGDNSGPTSWKGMTTFAESHVRIDDPRLPVVHDHFRRNLADICEAGESAGIPVVVSTVPVNLRDNAPFGSAPAPEDRAAAWEAAYQEGMRREAAGDFAAAIRSFEEASRIEALSAELEYRMARCHSAAGNAAEAARRYARARDLDTLRFRSDSTINDIIRQVCAARAGTKTRLADAEQAFAAESPGGVPGEEYFLEHVHFNFKGNVLLARTIFQAIAEVLPERIRAVSTGPAPGEKECAAWLAQTDWNEFNIGSQIREMFRKPPFTNQSDRAVRDARWDARLAALRSRLEKGGRAEAVTSHESASERSPDDWMMRMNFAQILTETGAPDRAVEQYEAALRAFPRCFPAHYKLGRLSLVMGEEYGAMRHFRAAIKAVPDYADAHYGVAECLSVMGKTDEALAVCEEQIRHKESNRPAALILQGNILVRAGRNNDARERYQAALPLVSDASVVHSLLGDLALSEGGTATAIKHYEAALQVRPEWPQMTAHVARLRQSLKDGKPPGK